MKKRLLTLFVVLILNVSMSIGTTAFAEEIETARGSNLVELFEPGQSLTGSANLDLDSRSTEKLRQSPESFVNYDAVLIHSNIVEKIDVDAAEQILQNGTKFVVYGEEIDFQKLIDIFGEGNSAFNEDIGQNGIVGVMLSTSFIDELSYSLFIKLYPSETKRVDANTEEETLLSVKYEQDNAIKKFDLLYVVNDTIQKTKEMDSRSIEIGKEPLEDETAYLQIPSDYEFASFFHTTWIGYVGGSEMAMTLLSPVYLYDKGRPTSNTNLHEWVIFSHNVGTAVTHFVADYVDVTLNAKYYSQNYKEYTHLTSQSSTGASLTMGVSLNNKGIQVSGSGSTSYSISTNGIEVANHPDPVLTLNPIVRWKGTSDGLFKVKENIKWWPFGPSIPFANTMYMEAALVIRGNNTTGWVKAKRTASFGCVDGNWDNYVLWGHYDTYSWSIPEGTNSNIIFNKSYYVYK